MRVAAWLLSRRAVSGRVRSRYERLPVWASVLVIGLVSGLLWWALISFVLWLL
jgi:hypothetical protein